MKNILLYTDTPQIGGAELQIFLLAKFLNKEQFNPILVCSNLPQLDRWCEKFRRFDIEVIRLNITSKHDPRHYFQLKKIIHERQIDLLHAHVWNPASCRYAYAAAATSGIPLITTEHDPFELSFFKDFLKKISLRATRAIVTVSTENSKLLKKLYPKHAAKILTIPCGIDLTWWQSQLLSFKSSDRRKIKEELFYANEDTLIITSIGELHERKNQRLLIEAIPEIVAEFSNIKFVFVGQGSERQNLEKLVEKLGIAPHVTFTGQQKNVAAILKSSDIFCLTSKREAFGLVNIEAMICGLPVIATKVGGIPEIIEEGKTGYLVDTAAELSEKLLHLIKSPTLRAKMGEAGIARAKKEFSAEKMAESYTKIYDEQ